MLARSWTNKSLNDNKIGLCTIKQFIYIIILIKRRLKIAKFGKSFTQNWKRGFETLPQVAPKRL